MDDPVLIAWAAELATELGIQPPLGVEAILKIAADAAHGVVRPAAPLTTFLVGLAIGQFGSDPSVVNEILARVQSAIDDHQAQPER